ncbi:ABC transporter ATP-binding protein [Brevibacillus laterosporus]|uniref:ABC transporter ATP-binding protein n=1 Tax=Brevibacillus laterosporus TaxID=1465 RepID=UPI000EB07A8E|nr:ABC transporter ATP-binding protein [Brevibacillus laterosporus]AYK09095.1 ABC transporter ATP-binding protein [Brevibacillus laterosporus]
MTEVLLDVKNLRTSFFTRAGEVQAVRGVSFSVHKGEIIGIVGESGSGKSVTAKSILSLIAHPGKIVGGQINFGEKDLLLATEKEHKAIRGNRIAMIFQDPMTSLNPVYKIGRQLTEVIIRHQKVSKSVAKQKAIEILKQVGISSAEERFNQYPHEFSGGMRQRVMIAMALSCEPELLIADEPTTALDVTIQAQILDLIKELANQSDTAVMLITHDLGVVAQVCTRVIVMYSGMVMEEGKVEEIFYRPQHPYTQGLLRSLPKHHKGNKERLTPIEGTPPSLLNPTNGCPFAERCPHMMDKCLNQIPPSYEMGSDQRMKCWLGEEIGGSRYENQRHFS